MTRWDRWQCYIDRDAVARIRLASVRSLRNLSAVGVSSVANRRSRCAETILLRQRIAVSQECSLCETLLSRDLWLTEICWLERYRVADSEDAEIYLRLHRLISVRCRNAWIDSSGRRPLVALACSKLILYCVTITATHTAATSNSQPYRLVYRSTFGSCQIA